MIKFSQVDNDKRERQPREEILSNLGQSIIHNVMFFLELSQLLFSPSKVSFCCGGVLLSRHVVEHDDITFLEMKSVQMIKSILSLAFDNSAVVTGREEKRTHVHNIIKYDERRALRFLFIPYPYLSNCSIASEQII